MSHTAAPARRSANSLHINLSDGPCAELWVRAITKAVQPATESLDVYFLGGRQLIEPAALLSLRNALMLIPESVTLRTIATASLPPFACAAWLAGDQRWIASGSRLWIPKLPENILRGHASPLPASTDRQADTPDDWPPNTETERDEDDSETPAGSNRRSGTRFAFSDCRCPTENGSCGCTRRRMATDLRDLASIVNEWFPCWEYAGAGISVDELCDLRVIEPGWIFGGLRGRRGNIVHVNPET